LVLARFIDLKYAVLGDIEKGAFRMSEEGIWEFNIK
jgi:hypothetical protein